MISERRDVIFIENGKEIYIETFPVIYEPMNFYYSPCVAPLDILEVTKNEPTQSSQEKLF